MKDLIKQKINLMADHRARAVADPRPREEVIRTIVAATRLLAKEYG